MAEELLVGVTGYQVLGNSVSGRTRALVPVAPLHAAFAGARTAVCGAYVIEVLDKPWPPGMGRCRDCYRALL